MSLIRTADWRIANAAHCKVACERIVSSEVAGSLQQIWRAYRTLDTETPRFRALRAALWQLAMTVTHTLLPFADGMPGARSLVARVCREPLLPDDFPANALSNAFSALFALAKNPKCARLREIAEELAGRNESLAVLSALTSSPATEGWPPGGMERLTVLLPGVTFAGTIRAIEARGASVLVVPSGGRHLSADVLQDLNFGGLAQRVTFLAYDTEHVRIGRLPQWGGGVIRGAPVLQPMAAGEFRGFVEQAEPDAQPWKWIPLADASQPHGSELVVAARAVRFEGGRVILLPEEARVIEISSLLTSETAHAPRLPRRAVTDLRRGDVLVVRLRGSGDYLDNVADELMSKAGEGDLRKRSSHWREALGEAMRTLGSAGIAHKLTQEGFASFVTPGYLAFYVSGIVIGPEDFERFESLLKALARSGFLHETDVSALACEHWEIIRKIRSYQRRAAGEIRAQLLSALSRQIEGGTRSPGDTISLKGAAAGELGLLRVADVDPERKHVGPGQLYQLESPDGELV
jgi:hypothetical protein